MLAVAGGLALATAACNKAEEGTETAADETSVEETAETPAEGAEEVAEAACEAAEEVAEGCCAAEGEEKAEGCCAAEGE